MGVFGEGGDNGMAGPEIGGTLVESDLSSLSSFSNLTLSSSRKRKNINKCIIQREETQLLLAEDRILSEGCDWPVENLPSEEYGRENMMVRWKVRGDF